MAKLTRGGIDLLVTIVRKAVLTAISKYINGICVRKSAYCSRTNALLAGSAWPPEKVTRPPNTSRPPHYI